MTETVEFEHECGETLRDIISGYEGVVMVQAKYSTGCIHYGLLSRELSKDGTNKEWAWVDQSRLEKVDMKVVKFNLVPGATSGAFPSGPES